MPCCPLPPAVHPTTNTLKPRIHPPALLQAVPLPPPTTSSPGTSTHMHPLYHQRRRRRGTRSHAETARRLKPSLFTSSSLPASPSCAVTQLKSLSISSLGKLPLHRASLPSPSLVSRVYKRPCACCCCAYPCLACLRLLLPCLPGCPCSSCVLLILLLLLLLLTAASSSSAASSSASMRRWYVSMPVRVHVASRLWIKVSHDACR